MQDFTSPSRPTFGSRRDSDASFSEPHPLIPQMFSTSPYSNFGSNGNRSKYATQTGGPVGPDPNDLQIQNFGGGTQDDGKFTIHLHFTNKYIYNVVKTKLTEDR